jgi:hypothetical protein
VFGVYIVSWASFLLSSSRARVGVKRRKMRRSVAFIVLCCWSCCVVVVVVVVVGVEVW